MKKHFHMPRVGYLAWGVFVLLGAACSGLSGLTGRLASSSEPVAPLGPASAYILPSTIRIMDGRLYSQIWVRNLGPQGQERLTVALHGPNGLVAQQTRDCLEKHNGVRNCDAFQESSGSGIDWRESTGMTLPLDTLKPGSYRLSVRAGVVTLASVELTLRQIPTVGGELTWTAIAPGAARMLYASYEGTLLWLPWDARMRGRHVIHLSWFGNRELIDEQRYQRETLYAYVAPRYRDVELDTPSFQVISLPLLPPDKLHGTITLIAHLDGKLTLGAWQFGLDPKVGFVSPQALIFSPSTFGGPWSFLGALPAVEPDPELVRQAIQGAHKLGLEKTDPIDSEPLACGIALKPPVRDLFKQLAIQLDAQDRSGAGFARAMRATRTRAEMRAYLAHGRRATQSELGAADRELGIMGNSSEQAIAGLRRRVHALASGFQQGCLKEALGPELGALLAH